ncbi:MAG: DUF58 domain-containing protein [Candidatus Woesearchaeota archaeon]
MYELKLNFKPILKQLEIFTKKEISGYFSGGYLSSVKGKGMDFDSFREYSPFDDASRIDWKASVRAQKLLVREFKEERNLEVVIVLDVSSSMCYTSTPSQSKAEYAAELASAIAFGILRAGDSVGLLMYSDHPAAELKANSGIKQYYNLLRQLSNPKLYEGKFNFKELMDYLNKKFKKGTVIILISDFIGLKPGWQDLIRVACKKFEMIGICVRDPMDNSIPEGIGKIVISDPFSNDQLMFDSEKIRGKYEKLNKEFLFELDKVFTESGGSLLQLLTSQHFVHRVNEFFIKRKKWR